MENSTFSDKFDNTNTNNNIDNVKIRSKNNGLIRESQVLKGYDLDMRGQEQLISEHTQQVEVRLRNTQSRSLLKRAPHRSARRSNENQANERLNHIKPPTMNKR